MSKNPYFLDQATFDKEIRAKLRPVATVHGLEEADLQPMLRAVHEIMTVTGRALQDERYGDAVRGLTMVRASVAFALGLFDGLAKTMADATGKPLKLVWNPEGEIEELCSKLADLQPDIKLRVMEGVMLMALEQTEAERQTMLGSADEVPKWLLVMTKSPKDIVAIKRALRNTV